MIVYIRLIGRIVTPSGDWEASLSLPPGPGDDAAARPGWPLFGAMKGEDIECLHELHVSEPVLRLVTYERKKMRSSMGRKIVGEVSQVRIEHG